VERRPAKTRLFRTRTPCIGNLARVGRFGQFARCPSWRVFTRGQDGPWRAGWRASAPRRTTLKVENSFHAPPRLSISQVQPNRKESGRQQGLDGSRGEDRRARDAGQPGVKAGGGDGEECSRGDQAEIQEKSL